MLPKSLSALLVVSMHISPGSEAEIGKNFFLCVLPREHTLSDNVIEMDSF